MLTSILGGDGDTNAEWMQEALAMDQQMSEIRRRLLEAEEEDETFDIPLPAPPPKRKSIPSPEDLAPLAYDGAYGGKSGDSIVSNVALDSADDVEDFSRRSWQEVCAVV